MPPLIADMLRIASNCGSALRGERDRALILLGFTGAFRRAERLKACQEGEGSLVHIATNPLRAHRPVAAVRSWLAVAGITAGCVFRQIARDDAIGRDGLSTESVRLILKEPGYRGDDLAYISPHSLRAGCITALTRAAMHEPDIMQHSRSASQTVMRGYIRAATTQEC